MKERNYMRHTSSDVPWSESGVGFDEDMSMELGRSGRADCFFVVDSDGGWRTEDGRARIPAYRIFSNQHFTTTSITASSSSLERDT